MKVRILLFSIFIYAITVTGCKQIEPEQKVNLNIDKTELTFNGNGGYAELLISCNGEWYIEHTHALSVYPDKGHGDTKISLNVHSNDTDVERNCDFIIKSQDKQVLVNILVRATGDFVFKTDKIGELKDMIPQSTPIRTLKIIGPVDSVDLDQIKQVSAQPYLTRVDLSEAVIKRIPNELFNSYRELEEVLLPHTLEEIGYGSFHACEKLHKINFHDNITTIEENAFGLTNFTEIILPKNLKVISNCLFQRIPSLKKVTLPPNLTQISYYAFGNTSLEDIDIPRSVVRIEWGAFSSTKLRRVIIPDNVIHLSGFSGCTDLESIQFPAGLQTIGNSAFLECTKLTAIELPEKLDSIGLSAFHNSGITNIKLRPNLRYIGHNALTGTKIKSLILPTFSNNEMDLFGIARDCYQLKAISIAQSHLTSIANSIASICHESESGRNNTCETVILQPCFTYLPNYIFADLNALKTIECHAIEPPAIEEYVFFNSKPQSELDLKVPAQSILKYKAAEMWREFKSITALEQ